MRMAGGRTRERWRGVGGGHFSSRSDRSGSAKWIRETGEHINQSGGREPSCTYGAQLRNHGLEGILADGEDGR